MASAWARPANPVGLISTGLVLLALGVAVGAYVYIVHTGQDIEHLEEEAAEIEVYQARARACLDTASRSLHGPATETAAKSARIAQGITLCLVQNREDDRLDLEGMRSCMAAVDAVNLLTDSGAPRTAC